jgi:uncharacterized protein involved in exopolysaccharide biosynthesis
MGDAEGIGQQFAQIAQKEIEKIKREGKDAYASMLTEAKIVDSQQRDAINKLIDETTQYQRVQREKIDQKLESIEEKVAKDFRGRLLAVIATVVTIAGGAAIASFQTVSHEVNGALREVNSDVRQLQTSTIAARDRIEKSSSDLVTSTTNIKDANSQLEKATVKYEGLSKQVDDARRQYEAQVQKYQDLSAQLEAARAEYADLTKRIKQTPGQNQ